MIEGADVAAIAESIRAVGENILQMPLQTMTDVRLAELATQSHVLRPASTVMLRRGPANRGNEFTYCGRERLHWPRLVDACMAANHPVAARGCRDVADLPRKILRRDCYPEISSGGAEFRIDVLYFLTNPLVESGISGAAGPWKVPATGSLQ